MGGLLLFAAVIAWAPALMMSPHGETVAERHRARAHRRVVIFVRNSAIGTLVLCGAVPAGCCFPPRGREWPARDWAIIGVHRRAGR